MNMRMMKMKIHETFYEFEMKDIIWVLTDFIKSYRESEKMNIDYTLELDGVLGQYNLDVYIYARNEKEQTLTYKYTFDYPAKVMDIYDVLTNVNDDIIYYLYSKHICEMRRNII